MSNKHQLKHWVFWPTFGFLAAGLVVSAVAPQSFNTMLGSLNLSILDTFTPVFSIASLLSLFTCLWVMVSPMGKLIIGGRDAKPVLNTWEWFTVVICTTTAAGILFWAMAEPIYHVHEPPGSLGIEPASADARLFAMKSLFHHWAFVPNALYCVFALLFAFVIFQMRLPFSLGSCLHPLLNRFSAGPLGTLTDGICLFSLVSGMAASMGAGILMLAGGTQHLTGIPSSPWLWMFFGSLIVVTFIASAIAGLKKGIQALSEWNVRFFAFLVVFILVAGPASYFLPLGWTAFGAYISDIVPNTLFLDFAAGDPWPKNWTVFYWANWLAWAPVTGLFLARIGVGYTYRMFVVMNLILPSLLCGMWTLLFGGTAIQMDSLAGNDLYGVLKNSGAEAVTFWVLGQLPLSQLTVPALLFTAFLAYVTAADSNTVAIAGISTRGIGGGIAAEQMDPPQAIKVLWGSVIGFLAIGALCSSGLDGVRGLSTLGGFPVLFLEFIAVANLLRVSVSPALFDRTACSVSTASAIEPEAAAVEVLLPPTVETPA